MTQSRRSFLKVAGVAGAVAATGKVGQVVAQAPPVRHGDRGMARGLTLLTMAAGTGWA